LIEMCVVYARCDICLGNIWLRFFPHYETDKC